MRQDQMFNMVFWKAFVAIIMAIIIAVVLLTGGLIGLLLALPLLVGAGIFIGALAVMFYLVLWGLYTSLGGRKALYTAVGLGLLFGSVWLVDKLYFHVPILVLVAGLGLGAAVALIAGVMVYAVAYIVYKIFSSYLFNFFMATMMLLILVFDPQSLISMLGATTAYGALAGFLGLGGFEAWWAGYREERDRKLYEEYQRNERAGRRQESRERRERAKEERRRSLAWCYKTLGIPVTATLQEVKQAYRRMALRYHPDINRSREAEARMKEINEAYERLNKALEKTRDT